MHSELARAREYPHFRTADPRALSSTATEVGWHVDGAAAVESWRTVNADDLWTWVSRALPLRTTDGTVLDHAVVQWDAIRAEFHAGLVASEDTGGLITLPMHGWIVQAHTD